MLTKIIGTIVALVLIFIPTPATTPAGLAMLVAIWAAKGK